MEEEAAKGVCLERAIVCMLFLLKTTSSSSLSLPSIALQSIYLLRNLPAIEPAKKKENMQKEQLP